MSIKKLFDSVDKNLQYADYKTQKEAFEPVESARNAIAIETKQKTYVPPIDYNKPENFAFYGSAYMYYSGAINRILDFYPYDGSRAEQNEFYNGLYAVEKYIFDKKYPKSTGYVIMSADGWGATDGSSMSDGYGMPSAQEYITFNGGPGTGSSGGTTLKSKMPNKHSSKTTYANIYQTDIYSPEGLPTDYGKGSRTSNLKADFNTGVTVEFWLKKPSFDTSKTVKEVVFDLWNSGSTGSGNYGRLTIEVDGEASGSPFRITAQSGSTPTGIFEQTIGTTPTIASLASWNHYALSFQNSGSNFVTKLFLNGYLDDTKTYGPVAATATVTITAAGGVSHGDTFALVDASGTSTTYLINGGGAWDAQSSEAAGGTVTVMIGGAGGGATGKVRIAAAINSKINLTTGAGFSSVTNGVDNVTITQSTTGPTGNKTNSDSISGATVTNFTGGAVGPLGDITLNSMFGRIGALLASPNTLSASAGSGKLSASVDEFRYWKVARDSKDIVENWFTQVGGGTNSDVSNATLGVYYKFNEGITTTSSVDRVVLDYAGRITNGAWTGYTANSRNTGSAMVSSSAATWEKQDPIMHAKHNSVVSLKNELFEKGKDHDSTNNSQFINYAPHWVIEKHEDEGNDNLKIISHIMGAYFDQVHMLTSEIPRLRFVNYTTASGTPMPFASHLPQSLGLYSPEIFVDADVMERFENRTEKKLFESKLNETKNLIYLNLYNNLASIYKSKGTAKSIRNVIRCFNIDDSLLKTNVYAKNTEFTLSNNLTQHVNEHTSLNFNQSGNVGAVVYQAIDPSNPYSKGYISGSLGSVSLANVENRYGCTVEADVTFPMYFTSKDKFPRKFTTVSLFGAHAVNTGSVQALSGTSLTYTTGAWGGTYDLGNFQVQAIREAEGSKNVYFKLTSSVYPNPLPELTSSTFYNVYDNSQWNLSVRLKPDTPLAELVTGAIGSYGYQVIFRGTNSILGNVRDSFELTGTVNHTTGSYFLRSPKRLYVGAQRTDITGTLIHKSDVKFENLKYWAKHIDNTSLNQHLFDSDNSGVSGSYKNISPQDKHSDHYDITNANMLALNWSFEQVATSDSTGNFIVQDISSGSAMMSDPANFGWIANVAGYQNTGYGKLFPASDTRVVEKLPLNMFKFTDPERVVGSDMINILSKDDEVYGTNQTLPDFVYSIEKSRNEVVSEQMLTFFAGVLDFNNLIGAPVNRYRDRYKELEYLREVFYRRVNSVSSIERYVEYYKWFDDAISQIIEQMIPASANLIEGVLNTIEPTVLERPKYETKFPTLQNEAPDPEGAMTGESFMNYPGRFGTRPAPEVTGSSAVAIGTVNLDYWAKRAERTDPVVSSKRFGLTDAAAAVIDAKREKIRKVVVSNPYLSRSAPTLYDNATSTLYTGQQFRILSLGKLQKVEAEPQNVQKTTVKTLGGGVNNINKANIQFVYTALHPHGPIDQSGGRYVPQNILLGFIKDMVPEPYDNEPKPATLKTKRELSVMHGRNATPGDASTTGQGYFDNLKASYAFPFNIMSSSLTKTEASGYQKEIRDKLSASIDIVNLHNDVYGPDGDVPMQGPFTNYAVGGHQSRHVRVNYSSSARTLDTRKTRPEAWKIFLGTCDGTLSGAIGMTGPDYPHPTDYDSTNPYPNTSSQKAIYYRDMIAKRPVNIRNIHYTTGSTILGNFQEKYEILQAPGAHSNARAWAKYYANNDTTPTFPANAFQGTANDTTVINTFLDMPTMLRSGTMPDWPYNLNEPSSSRFTFVDDYSTSYLTGAVNKSITVTRFANNGGAEVMNRGHQDFKAAEYSVYNSLNFKNLAIKKPWQASRGTISETDGIRVGDIHDNDYGLTSHLSRYTARFGRDSLAFPHTEAERDEYDLTKPFTGYSEEKQFRGWTKNLQGWWRLNTNLSLGISGDAPDSSGRGRNGTFDAVGDRPSFSSTRFPSKYIQTASCDFTAASNEKVNIGTAATWDNIIGDDNNSTRQMTFCAWIFKEGAGGNSLGNIIHFGEVGTGLNGGIMLATTATQSVKFYAHWNGAYVEWGTDLANLFELNQWAHIAVTYDATNVNNDPKIYVNGIEYAVSVTAGTKTGVYNGVNTRPCYIANDFGDRYAFEGTISDVGVWNKTLPSAEIRAIYNASLLPFKRGPGASNVKADRKYDYEQPPGFHKVHRNNLTKWEHKIGYGSYTLFTGINNDKCIEFNDDDGGSGIVGACLTIGDAATDLASQRAARIFDAEYGKSSTSNKVSFSWQCWLNFTNDVDERTLFQLGWNTDASANPIHYLYRLNDGNIRYKMLTKGQGGAHSFATYNTTTTPITGSGWKHIGFSLYTVHGACDSTTVPLLSVNGQQHAFTPASAPEIYLVSGSSTYANFRSSGNGFQAPIIFFGQIDDITSGEPHGKADEMAMWAGQLSIANFKTLYNEGVPCNLTASSTVGSSSLLSWWRCGDHVGDEMKIGPGDNVTAWNSAATGIIQDAKGNADLTVMARVGSPLGSSFADASLAGCPTITLGYPYTGIAAGYKSASTYDNFYVQHQIPRSSKQYRWITASLIEDNFTQFYGFTPPSFQIPNLVNGVQQGTKNAYTFVSQSDFGAYFQTGSVTGPNRYGWTSSSIKNGANVKRFIPVDFVGLNTVIVDEINTDTNTVGRLGNNPRIASDGINYINYSHTKAGAGPGQNGGGFINKVSNLESSASILNSINLNRGGAFGYPMWKMTPGRHAMNPILRAERKANTLSMIPEFGEAAPAGNQLIKYNVPPVSMHGRPSLINVSQTGLAAGTMAIPFTLVASNDNESIYFTDPNLDNQFDNLNYYHYETPFMMVMSTVGPGGDLGGGMGGYSLNWVLYKQQLFPSLLNEFASTRKRLNYDNRFWRSNRINRNSKSAFGRNVLTRSVGIPSFSYDYFQNNYSASLNSFNQWVKQSGWPLDAPDNFMTRASVPYTTGSAFVATKGAQMSKAQYKGRTGSAGELQNTYTNFFSGTAMQGYADLLNTGVNTTWKTGSVAIRHIYAACGALYARKHMISIPNSVAPPNGVRIHQTGATWYTPVVDSDYVTSDGTSPHPYLRNPNGQTWSNAQWLTGAWLKTSQLDIGAGEALWEAGTTAGKTKRKLAFSSSTDVYGTFETKFEPSGSEPWFDSYADFTEIIDLVAKDYAILPEYRMSENVKEYTKLEEFPDTFELTVPGASENVNEPLFGQIGSNLGTPDFYKDYSNADFLGQDVQKIYQKTGQFPTEIALTASAMIRFNPYKGFYPVQRTMDLVKTFNEEYSSAFKATYKYNSSGSSATPIWVVRNLENQAFITPQDFPDAVGASNLAIRPMAQALFSPGILYNSIKSGMAVDWPLVTDAEIVHPMYAGTASNGATVNPDWLVQPGHSGSRDRTIQTYAMGFSDDLLNKPISNTEYTTIIKNFFGKRLPFETMLQPHRYLKNTTFFDMEANPSASLKYTTASFTSAEESTNYSKMSQNFFGQVADFFLEDSDFTTIKSQYTNKIYNFDAGSTYLARIKMRKSMTGQRNYISESFMSRYWRDNHSGTVRAATHNPYTTIGGRALNTNATTGAPTGFWSWTSGSDFLSGGMGYEIPQDPVFDLSKETFTMYSRPSAFGPDLTGRFSFNQDESYRVGITQSANAFPLDCFSGFNWAYTPPYYHGEAWCDLIFHPSGGVDYTLEKIMQETKTVYWRHDAGIMTGTCVASGHLNFNSAQTLLYNSLYPGDVGTGLSQGVLAEMYAKAPYGGNQVNRTAMQMSASINLFGIEETSFLERQQYPPTTTVRNTGTYKRWVIKPKFETPMMNFNDSGIRPLTNSAGGAANPTGASPTFLSIPANLSSSVPRGMWHQFGVLEPDPAKGIFLEIGDVPDNWIRHHYYFLNTGSVYNNYQKTLRPDGSIMTRPIFSLVDLLGFGEQTATSKKLGKLKENKKVKEAIVAIPYRVAEEIEDPTSLSAFLSKEFISIPAPMYEAAIKENVSVEGDTLETAGASIRNLIQQMDEFLLPPQIDFINNPSAPPMVMYIFSFEYNLDKDDLSYIWQNTAPSEFKKLTKQNASIAHYLMDQELLNAALLSGVEDSEDDSVNPLRWMVFKVKQKAKVRYDNLVADQINRTGLTMATKVDLSSLPFPDRPVLDRAKITAIERFENGGMPRVSDAKPISRIDGADEPASFEDRYQHNWPYDYLSFVEAVKIDANILYTRTGPPATIVNDASDSTESMPVGSMTADPPSTFTQIGPIGNLADAANVLRNSGAGALGGGSGGSGGGGGGFGGSGGGGGGGVTFGGFGPYGRNLGVFNPETATFGTGIGSTGTDAGSAAGWGTGELGEGDGSGGGFM